MRAIDEPSAGRRPRIERVIFTSSAAVYGIAAPDSAEDGPPRRSRPTEVPSCSPSRCIARGKLKHLGAGCW